MSAASKSNKGGSNNSFETYRQIAPETVDDQRLRSIIKNNNNDHNAIVAAIENIWHDTPDEKAVGSEWVTTSKAKKQEAPASKPSRDSGRRETGGRGGAGRGRSLLPAGGRGGGDGRGAPRPASVKPPTGGRDSPAVRASPTVQENETAEEATEVVSEPVVVAAAPAPVSAPAVPAAGGVAWGRGASLAQKLKEAEKQKDVVKVEAPVKVQEEASGASAAAESDGQKRSRGSRRPRGASAGAAPAAEKRGAEDAVAEVTESTAALAVEEKKIEEVAVPPPPPLVQVSAAPVETVRVPEVVAAAPVASAPQQQQGFLNMGKWEAPVEAAAEIGAAFQFGSFGNNVYGEDDSASSGVSASQVGTNPSAAPWTGLHSAEDSSNNNKTSNVWGASSEQSLDISSGLFSAQQTAASSSSANKVDASADASGLSANTNVAATRAPPGLAQNKNSNNTANNNNNARPVGQQQAKKAEVPSQPVQQQQTQLPVYQQQQQQYNQQQQQGGMPPGMNNRNPLGLNPSLGGLPYPYNAGPFDLLAHQQAAAQYGAYPLGAAQVPPLAPVAATSSAASTSTNAATAATTPAAGAPNANANAALAQQQAQQYAAQQAAAAAAAAYPYYPNPYYPNQYYYGQQMPGFYNQGRDMYQQQQQRPYANNPYGNAGALYPGDVYGQQQAGQFPDAFQQGAAGGAAGASAAGSSNNNKAAKSANAGNAAGAVGAAQGLNPDQHTANLLMNSGYGYVNPYNQPRQDAWQQQQGGYPGAQQAGGWPMMYGAPGAASTPAALGGVGVGGGFAPQQGQNAGAAQQGQGNNNNSNRGNNNSNNNAYANNSFGGRGAGGVAPAPAGGVTQNCVSDFLAGRYALLLAQQLAAVLRSGLREPKVLDREQKDGSQSGSLCHYVDRLIRRSDLPKPEPKPFQEKKINDISDIDGSRSGPKYQHYFNKPQFLQSDVQGSTSKALSWGRNVRDNSLYIDDIDGTRHSIKDRMMRTGRHVDPLAPNYALPSYVPAEDPPTKFIKDPQNHSDIEGSFSKTKKYFATRDTMRIDDISGTRPKQLRGSLDPGSMGYNGPEISAPTHRFKDRTTRVTDPNNPQYHVNGMDYADDKYTKPKQPKAYIADNHLLQTKDITGATPGFKDTRFERREIRNINYIADIEGAHADSIKHSIVTNRQSNPMAPVYQSLDAGELLQPVVLPLIPPAMVKVPTVPVQRGSRPKEPEQTHGVSFGDSTHNAATSKFDDNDYDPVSFANTAAETGKPPSGRFHLDFSGTQPQSANGGSGYGGFSGGSGRKNQDASPYGSARGQQYQYGGSGSGGRSRMGNAAANSFNATTGSYFNDTTGGGSARGNSGGGNAGNKTLSFLSPAPSARGGGNNSGRLTPQERRAYLERSAEISAVRDLRQ